MMLAEGMKRRKLMRIDERNFLNQVMEDVGLTSQLAFHNTDLDLNPSFQTSSL